MKALLALTLVWSAGCSLAPVANQSEQVLGQDGSCEVSYPQLPRCECGCAGDICKTATMGVVVCDSLRAQGPPGAGLVK
jgi:hypothetical protein